MAVVDVCVHAEQPLEDGAHHLHEVGRERLTKLAWEHRRIVDLGNIVLQGQQMELSRSQGCNRATEW
jgi:hypothetical protein